MFGLIWALVIGLLAGTVTSSCRPGSTRGLLRNQSDRRYRCYLGDVSRAGAQCISAVAGCLTRLIRIAL